MKSIEIIQKIIELSRQLVVETQKFVEFVEKAAEKVENAAAAGQKALAAIAKYSRENIIDIKHICFKAALSKVKDACLGFSIDVVFGGSHPVKFNLDACIDVSFVRKLGKAIADAVLPGIANVKEKLAKAKEFFSNIGRLLIKDKILVALPLPQLLS